MRKKFLLISLALIMLLLSACSPAETAATEPKNSQEASATGAQEPTPSPSPTPNPAKVFAQEKGILLPDIDAEFITDYEEVAKVLDGQRFWTRESTNTEDDEFGDMEVYYFGENSVFLAYNDFIGDLYFGGDWSIGEDGIAITTMDGHTTTSVPIISKTDAGICLYIYDDVMPSVYRPSTDAEALMVTTDTEDISTFRSFLCSASWELCGHFDEAGNLNELPHTRVFTFLPDGQIVLKENGEYIKGRYILNTDLLDFVLEDGQRYSNIISVDNSTGVSYIYLYTESMSAEYDLYWAVSKRNVSDIVTLGEPIQARGDVSASWSIVINGNSFTKEEIAAVAAASPINIEGHSCRGYLFMPLASLAGVKEFGGGVTVVFEDGTKKEIEAAQSLMGAFLIVEKDGEALDKPLLGLSNMKGMFGKDELYESPVVEIVIG